MLRIHMPVTIRHPVADVDCTYLACLVSSPSGEGDSKDVLKQGYWTPTAPFWYNNSQ